MCIRDSPSVLRIGYALSGTDLVLVFGTGLALVSGTDLVLVCSTDVALVSGTDLVLVGTSLRRQRARVPRRVSRRSAWAYASECAGGSPAWAVGDRVRCLHHTTRAYWPAVIAQTTADGRFVVRWDDGDTTEIDAMRGSGFEMLRLGRRD
eukprot:3025507-Rhodomonas_salina.1